MAVIKHRGTGFFNKNAPSANLESLKKLQKSFEVRQEQNCNEIFGCI